MQISNIKFVNVKFTRLTYHDKGMKCNNFKKFSGAGRRRKEKFLKFVAWNDWRDILNKYI